MSIITDSRLLALRSIIRRETNRTRILMNKLATNYVRWNEWPIHFWQLKIHWPMRLPQNYTVGIDECVGDIDTIKNVDYYWVKL